MLDGTLYYAENVILYHKVLVNNSLIRRVLVGIGFAMILVDPDPTRVLVDVSSAKGIGR